MLIKKRISIHKTMIDIKPEYHSTGDGEKAAKIELKGNATNKGMKHKAPVVIAVLIFPSLWNKLETKCIHAR
ncbi:MAG: hypothetical protein A3J83_02600 [Elusimicrobia bacterium RIFOXYA2_FULL_40_6]|nr:MAG: hypothetical protein A3J83_02600 [Elusimicrobia bacterium RIFOXYA2_FULL_40_6]